MYIFPQLKTGGNVAGPWNASAWEEGLASGSRRTKHLLTFNKEGGLTKTREGGRRGGGEEGGGGGGGNG